MALIAGYGFAETSGTAVLDVTGLHPGSISGATRTTSGKYGAALTFDGSNDIINIPHVSDLNPSASLSVLAWVYPTRSASDWQTIVLKEQSGEQTYCLAASTSTSGRPGGVVYLSSGKKYVYGTAALAVNTWSHLALTYDGATICLYVNGVQVGSLAATGTVVTSTLPLRIGGNTTWGEYFGGRIDDVRLYSGALTATEIQAAMAVAVDPVTPPTIPPVPTMLQAVLSGQLEVGWTWEPAPGSSGLPSGYVVEIQAPGGNWTQVASVGGTVFTRQIPGLTLEQMYGFTVKPLGATLTLPAPILHAAIQRDATLIEES